MFLYISKVFYALSLNLNFKGKKNADRVTSYLAEIYPALFKVDESQDVQASKVGYGLGGVKGLKNLSKVICQRHV